MEGRQKHTNLYPKFISGLVSQTVTWPIEYSKIVRQLPGNNHKKLFTVLRNDYSKYGFRNLFKSMVPHAITSGPRVLVRLQTYEMLKGSEIGEKSDVYRTVLAGGIAGAIEGSIVMAPSELVKVMLINHPEYSVWKCVSEIYYYFKKYNYKTIIMGASFRNIDQVAALSGCDRLTINPTLITELSNKLSNVKSVLNEKIIFEKNKPDRIKESDFYLELAKNKMATCKLNEGILKFIEDTEKIISF